MAVEPQIPELQAAENKDLLDLYKKGTIGAEEEVQLFELIYSLKEKYQKKFKLRDVLKSSFDYTDFEVKRLESEYNKWLKREEKNDSSILTPPGPAAPTIITKAKQVGEGATKALLGELQELGNVLVLQYGQKAALRGLGVKDYTIKCVEFYEQYGDQVGEIVKENISLKALCSILVQAAKPQFKQLAASRMYLDWTTELMQLNALGFTMDENLINDVTQKIEAAMGIKIL